MLKFYHKYKKCISCFIYCLKLLKNQNFKICVHSFKMCVPTVLADFYNDAWEIETQR